MKYNIALSLVHRSNGTMSVDAPSLENARNIARYLHPREVPDWQVVETEMTILAVTHAGETCTCGITNSIPAHVLESLRFVVDYFYDYAAEGYPTTQYRDGHIFEHLSTLDRWLGRPVEGNPHKKISSSK